MISSSDDGTFAVWDVATFKKLRAVHIGDGIKVKSSQFSANGNLIVTASDDGAVVLWDARSREKVRLVSKHDGPATCCAFSNDSNTVISGGWDKLVFVSDSRATEKKEVIGGSEDWIQAVAISPDKDRGATIAFSGWDPIIRTWQITPNIEKAPFVGHAKTVSALSISYDSRLLASASYDNCVKIWNLSTSKLEKTLAGHHGKVNALCFSPKNDGLVLSAGSDHRVILWDVSSGNLKNEFLCQGPATAVSAQRSQRDLIMVFGDSIGNIDIAKLVTH